MWNNPATQSNIADLLGRGVVIVGPGVGALTGEDTGVGRMAEPEEIVAATYAAIAAAPATQKPALVETGDLVGRHLLITAGGTREPIDPVRFIGNRSSGTQAVALAARALSRGATVTLIAAHIECEPPVGAEVVTVSSAEEMAAAVDAAVGESDVVIMAAAVADYRPAVVSQSKVKKDVLGNTMSLELVQNPDILATVAASKRAHQLIVGFAAETESDHARLLEIARAKLARKGCDLLVVNRVGWDLGFGTGKNEVSVLSSDGSILSDMKGSKLSVADGILDVIAARVPFQNA